MSSERSDDQESNGAQLARLGTDGEAWAREWMRLNPIGLMAANEDDLDALRAWFANAIEAGRSAGYMEGIRASDECRAFLLGLEDSPHA